MPDATATTPVLEVRDLTVTFRSKQSTVHAIRGVNFEVNRGEFLAIVGESGSGKSVSSMAVMGLLPATAEVAGSIKLKGRELLGMSDRELSKLRGKGIAMIFQDPLSALTPVYTIGQQIVEGLTLHDRALGREAALARAVELLDIVGIPEPERRVNAFPHEFSGGMRQRAMIAIAIANNPELIIADEPTTALDVTIQAQILDVLQKAREITGAAIVLITHDLGVVAGNADRVAVMYAGRIIESAPVDDLFARPMMPYTIGLLRSMPTIAGSGKGDRLIPLEGRPPQLTEPPVGCPFAPRCPVARHECGTEEPALVDIGAAHRVACIRSEEVAVGTLDRTTIYPTPAPVEDVVEVESDEEVISLVDVKRHFPLTRGSVFRRRVGTVRAVDGVSLRLRAGQTLGLVGESGSGKTTTIMEIMELVAPQTGTIRVLGKDVATLDKGGRRKLREDIQIVFQDPMASIDPRMSIQEVIGEPMTVHGASPQEIASRVAELLETVGLDPQHAGRYPHEFSGGQRQRIGIARALAVAPRVLVLDEPVSALDVSVQAGVINLLEDLKDTLGLSYLFVAHDLAVVHHIADVVAVMYLGRIVEYGPRDDVFGDPRHPYTRALISAAPVPDPVLERTRERILLDGDLPSPTSEIVGCPFRGRCPLYDLLPESDRTRCETEAPALTIAGRSDGERTAACHYADRTWNADEVLD